MEENDMKTVPITIWDSTKYNYWGGSIVWDVFGKTITGAKTGLCKGHYVSFPIKNKGKKYTGLYLITKVRYSDNVHDLFWADVEFHGAKDR